MESVLQKKTGPKGLFAYEMQSGELAAPGGNYDVSGTYNTASPAKS